MSDENGSRVYGPSGSLQEQDNQGLEAALEPKPKSATEEKTHHIVVAATFTADLILQPLRFWMDKLEISAQVSMASYAQVIQELLKPNSQLSNNKEGFNVLLVRLEDWVRGGGENEAQDVEQHLRRAVNDFADALEASRSRTRAPLLLFLCPPRSSGSYSAWLQELMSDLTVRLSALPGVHCWTPADLVQLYPVLVYEDEQADRVGHVPYTSEYFTAIATLLTRRIAVLIRSRFKVIALDCDNTLWKGVCGEVGPTGIELTTAHLDFQRMLVRQHNAGILLCLCSKNELSDVEAVFRAHPEMPLREEHFVSSRVNWSSKSSNITSLSNELGLALDSFIFVDDSPLECSEVGTQCPAVLALQFPETAEEVLHFTDHIWAFDRVGVTEEAKQRTQQYKQNAARARTREKVTDYRQFLASLELKVTVSPMQQEQLARVAELIQRTNQFNLSGLRRSVGEIDALVRDGNIRCRVIHVQDRFGDYGLVGVIFLGSDAETLSVDSFVLSCRVLGRGVEYQIANELGRIARREGASNIELRFKRTIRNTPAWEFLDRAFRKFGVAKEEDGVPASEYIFRVPADYAEAVADESPSDSSVDSDATPAVTHQPIVVNNWVQTAFRLSRLTDIFREMAGSVVRTRREAAEHVAPRTHMEAAVADIWAAALCLDQVSVRDDFIELGGDSLLAVQVIARIASVLGFELSIYDFFSCATVEAIAEKLADAVQSSRQIDPMDRAARALVSLAQKRLWFIDQMEGGSAAYRIPLRLRLQGELDKAALQAALDALVARHESLRTTFVKDDGELVQRIASEARFELQVTALRGKEPYEREVEAHSRDELAATFDLAAGPLVRGRLLQLTREEHVLLITMHHMISDGWSLTVFIRELAALYDASCKGAADPLLPLSIQYVDYAVWQQQELLSARVREQVEYWQEHLQGAPELITLPTDRPRPPVQSYNGATVTFALGREFTAELKELARRRNSTVAVTACTAWSVVLSRLSGQDDIVLGMPVANRQRTEIEGSIGLFVNTLAVRVRMDDDPAIAQLLQRVREIMLAASTHQDAPFEKVVEAIHPARRLSHSPVFQVMFVMQPKSREVIELPGLRLREESTPLQTTKFDLTLNLQESNEGLVGAVNYSSDLFDGETIQRWVGYFKLVLQGIVRQPEQRTTRLPMMDEDERRKVIEHFNDTHAPYPHTQGIHELFELQVTRSPDAVALVHEGQTLSYAELNRKANQLAHYLRGKDVGPDQLVAIFIDRSIEMVVALLGVLKAGGAYLPLDPSNPGGRLEHILDDAQPRVLLTREELRGSLPQQDAEVITLDGDWQKIGRQAGENLDLRALKWTPEHLAYVIYTSGSTGGPKGVMIQHQSIVNYAMHIIRQFDVPAGQGSLICTSISYDLALTGLYPVLLAGQTVRLCSGQGALSNLADAVMKCRDLAPLKLTPSHLGLLEQPLVEGRLEGRIRALVLGGEQLHARAVESWRRYAPGTRIFNHYGPTEATVGCVAGEVAERVSGVAPLGRPISNTQIYIVDAHRQPVQVGVVGEICIGGVGLARGYWNRPELTAERFVSNPFSANPIARLYMTGDLARWRADGTIEYLGRNDGQVKIRGYRVEPGEIEAQLIRHELVNEAVVIAREDVAGDQRLVAYVVPKDAAARPRKESLRAHLLSLLPEHMVPSAFSVIERIPLTSNGKRDKRALPAPDDAAYVSREYEPPHGELEELLARVWGALLRRERVGRHDNFFELGGHSLLAMQVVAHVQSSLALEIPVRLLFEHPTLQQFSDRVSEIRRVSLFDRVASGGTEVSELLARVAAMTEREALELLSELEREVAALGSVSSASEE